MNSIFLFDANIFNTMEYEDLKLYTERCWNLLTDDVIKELLKVKDKSSNEEFAKKLNLVFNDNDGLNDNFSLLISHVPFGLDMIIQNSKNCYDFKKNPIVCSAHHFWLRLIMCPYLITDLNRHYNSMLTWHLKSDKVKYDDPLLQNLKNKIRLDEVKIAEPYFRDSYIEAKRIVKTWSKRDRDIRDNKYKITDSRMVMHAMDIMLALKTSINILTSDYDLIDLQNTVFDCILDQYVIYEVLKKKCEIMDFQGHEHKVIFLPIDEFKIVHYEVIEKIKKCDEFLVFTVWFYNRETKKVYPFEKILPYWLYEFALNFKGNLDCYALNKEYYRNYPFEYIWFSQPKNDKIKFEVWKRDTTGIANMFEPMLCKVKCKYELEEINAPDKLGGFIDPDEL